MSEKERKKAKERVKDVDDEEPKRELLISGILKKRRIPDVFSLYVNRNLLVLCNNGTEQYLNFSHTTFLLFL